uniref:Uncharacterized protein n=1 Tax=Caenorhabditis tropicalis TaxID=1561998 RepID=A0A1I7TJ00_9PELO
MWGRLVGLARRIDSSTNTDEKFDMHQGNGGRIIIIRQNRRTAEDNRINENEEASDNGQRILQYGEDREQGKLYFT